MKRKAEILIVAAAIFLAIIVCCTLYAHGRGATLKSWRLLGMHSIDIIHHADRVETYRIKDESGEGKNIEGYALIGVSKQNSPTFARKVAATVLKVYDTKPYLQMGMSGCAFSPGVAFRFIKGGEVLDALVCYDCSDVQLVTKPGTIDSGGFNSEYRAMKGLAKEAFPHDEEIQKI